MAAREATGRVRTRVAKRVRREIFVLTPEEKKTLCFVFAAFILGLATVYYRGAHSLASPKTEMNVRRSASPNPAQKRATEKPPQEPK